MITTSMPLTSAYLRQNISDKMNIYVHQETKSTNGKLKHLYLNLLYYKSSVFGTFHFKMKVFPFIILPTLQQY